MKFAGMLMEPRFWLSGGLETAQAETVRHPIPNSTF